MHLIFFAMILVLSACASQTEVNRPSNQPASKFIQGERIYIQNCLPCHSGDGKGAFAGVSDMTQIEVFKSGIASDDTLFQYIEPIKKGINSTNGLSMPPKGGNPHLTDQDIREVLQYMRERFAPL